MSNSATPVLEARNITKLFPGVVANEDIHLTLQKGEILALLGENGAGKSTLMHIIFGLYRPTRGEIWVNGAPVVMKNPRTALQLGIGMVHQHFQLVPVMSVTDNVMLGDERVKGGFLDRDAVAARIRELSQKYGLEVDPDALIEDLPLSVVTAAKPALAEGAMVGVSIPAAAIHLFDAGTGRRIAAEPSLQHAKETV